MRLVGISILLSITGAAPYLAYSISKASEYRIEHLSGKTLWKYNPRIPIWGSVFVGTTSHKHKPLTCVFPNNSSILIKASEYVFCFIKTAKAENVVLVLGENVNNVCFVTSVLIRLKCELLTLNKYLKCCSPLRDLSPVLLLHPGLRWCHQPQTGNLRWQWGVLSQVYYSLLCQALVCVSELWKLDIMVYYVKLYE